MNIRLLWIAPYPPLPIFGGGTRVYNLMKALAAHSDIAIDLIALGEHAGDAAPPPALHALCRSVEIVPPTASSRRLAQLRSLVSPRPFEYTVTYSPRMQERIDHALARHSYDAVVVEHSFTGYYRIPKHIPIILDQHNVESMVLLRAASHDRTRLRRAYNWINGHKLLADERGICRAANLLLATSAQDCAAMERWGAMPPCVVIPNGVDTDYFTQRPREEGTTPRLLFTASMHYAPNIEAMLYFTREIWPLVREQRTDAELAIVGGSAPPEVVALGDIPGVTLLGFVPDLRPVLTSATVVVVPLRIGGGTRLKIVEALAMGRAVVSTSLGCEGLDVEDGQTIVVADTSRAFADAIINLLNDPDARARLGRKGRRLVEEHYDWVPIGDRLVAALQPLLERRNELTTQVNNK